MTINNKFNLGDQVYVKVDPLQSVNMVVEIVVTPVGLYYTISNGDSERQFYAMELSKDEDSVKKITSNKTITV